MKSIFYIFLLLFGATLFSEAASRGDVKVTEASENIRYLSQKMVKEYLFFVKNPQRREVRIGLTKTLNNLSADLRIIARTTKDSDTKDILEFLAYSKDQIEELLNGKSDNEKAALMLDYSETLLEGADSIGQAHQYDFSKEEKMLMLTKKIEYLLERVTKYYMAVHAGFDSATNKEQMQKAIWKIEEGLLEVSLYNYPDDMKNIQKSINDSWKENKIFFNTSETLFIPKLLLLSVAYLETMVEKLSLYHSKNQ